MDGYLDVIPSGSSEIDSIMRDLPESCQADIDKAISEIRSITKRNRKELFEIGRSCSRIRDVICEHKNMSMNQVADAVGMPRASFARAVRVFEIWEPYSNAVQMISPGVMSEIAMSPSSDADEWLNRAIKLARDGVDITRSVFEHQIKGPELSPPVSKQTKPVDSSPPEEDDHEEEEDVDEDEPEHVADEPVKKEPSIVVRSAQDLEAKRQELVRSVVDTVGRRLRDVDDFAREHHIVKGTWYSSLEEGVNHIMFGIRSWPEIEPSR